MKLNWRDLVGYGFDEILFFLGHYIICPGGKDCKKSTTFNGFFALIHILSHEAKNAIIMRKEIKLHKDSTLNDFRFALTKLSEKTGFDWFSLFHITVSPSPKVVFMPTGQQILFLGFDNKNSNRFSSVKPVVGLNTLLIIDEAIERGQGGQSDVEEKEWLETFDQLHDSVFRGDYVSYGLDFEKDCKTIISFNPWSGKNWVDSLFMSDIEESEEVLERDGRQIFIDLEFDFLAKGKMVLFVNSLINEFIPRQKLISKFVRKYSDPDLYRTSTLGARGEFSGGIYNHLVKYINYSDHIAADLKVVSYTGGGDWGPVKDATTNFLLGFNEDRSHLYVLDGTSYERGTAKRKLNPDEQAWATVDFYEEVSERYPWILKGLPVFIDGHAIEYIHNLNSIAEKRGLTWLSFIAQKKPKKGQRIQTLKLLLSSKNVTVVENPLGNGISMWIKELRKSKYDKYGEREDKFDHNINGNEYGWLHFMEEINYALGC